jgi:DNA-binding GntR family transcriptional regulator
MARDAEAAIALDDEWHLELIAACPNLVLIGLIEGIMLRTRRYELALLRERPNLSRSSADHDSILSALSARDLPAACAGLKANMESAQEPMIAWLTARQARAAA